ncbi:MAG TPA: rhodanese-like domain-containing protein [Gemmatimonadaceae bacterium]|nr:rhodanese-like domain-containing protein [Gemmatimonadaceae bacterium]
MRNVLLTLACSALPMLAGAQRDARATLLISPADLAARMQRGSVVLLHLGDKAQYDSAHIAGARFMTLQDVSVSGATSPDGLTLQLPSPDSLRARLAALGVGDSSYVVVYYGRDWITPATRVMFTLDYAGLGARSALLDGGMQRWMHEGHPVTAEVPAPNTASLAPLHTRPIVVDANWVSAHLGATHVAVVDSRDTVFYHGLRAGGRPDNPHRLGHIAGAHSVFFATLYDSTNTLKSAPELLALFKAAGVQPGDTVVTYCHIGQQASATLFAARTLGFPVLLYDGSFEDWSRRAELPVVKP